MTLKSNVRPVGRFKVDRQKQLFYIPAEEKPGLAASSIVGATD
jgi:hypothetical protein